MRFRSRSNFEASRARMEQALVEVVGEYGYRGATAALICERAGVERAEFDRSYTDLEDCFCQVFEGMGKSFLMEMLSAFGQHERWRDQLRAVAYAFLRYLQEDPARARLTAIETLFAGERAQVLRDQVFSGLFALIDLGRQEMEDPDALTPATAEAIGGAIFKQIRTAVEAGNPEALTELVPKMMYSAVLPYLGPEVAFEELGIPPPP